MAGTTTKTLAVAVLRPAAIPVATTLAVAPEATARTKGSAFGRSLKVKAAIEREESDARISFPEHKQARPQVKSEE